MPPQSCLYSQPGRVAVNFESTVTFIYRQPHIRTSRQDLLGGEKIGKDEKRPAGREYGENRQALEFHACPVLHCKAKAGAPCVGMKNAKFPKGYAWPKSKVHAPRLALYKEAQN